MKTPFDLISLILFAGIAVLFLQRSTGSERDHVAIWRYGAAAVGCAVGDYLGNQGQPFIAGALLFAVVAFAVLMLDIMPRSGR